MFLLNERSVLNHVCAQMKARFKSNIEKISILNIRGGITLTLQKGVTLLELLVTLSIFFICYTLVIEGLPLFLVQNERDLFLDKLKNTIEFAKQEAFSKNKSITLCASQNKKTCSLLGNWSLGFIVFENDAKRRQPTPGALLYGVDGLHYGNIYFSANGNELHISPQGITTNIGSWVYCPKSGRFVKPKGLVINWGLRTYLSDENAELTKNMAFVCKRNQN